MKIINEVVTRTAHKNHVCSICGSTIFYGSKYESHNHVVFCGDKCKVNYFATVNHIQDKAILFLGTLNNENNSFSLFVCEKEGKCFLTRGRLHPKKTIGIASHNLDSEGFFWVNGASQPISSLSGDGITLKKGENKISFNSMALSVYL